LFKVCKRSLTKRREASSITGEDTTDEKPKYNNYIGDNKMKKEDKENQNEIAEQKLMAQSTVNDLVDNQIKGDSIAEDLIILLGATDENFENPLTQELELQMDTLTGDKLKQLKASVKGELQTRVKMPIVQRELLDTVAEPERHKKFKLTVKKVKSTMIGSEEFPMFTSDDLGKFKVIITPSKQTEDKTFEEELLKLMDKHGQTVADVRIFCDNFAGE
jgi:hypothetical protein